jgi:phospholipid transport system substrate-binding protein
MQLFRDTVTRRRLLGTALGTLALATFGSVKAITPTSDPAEQVVLRLIGQLWPLMSGDDIDRAKLLATLEEEIDLSLLGRLALGLHWRQANPDQQAEYQELFRSFMLSMVVQRLKPYVGTDLGRPDERFEIMASQPVGKHDVLVHSRVMPPSSQPLRVDWRLRQRAEGPVIIDLVVEGISLLVTQRSEFAAVIERSGMDGLLNELRERVTRPA